MQSKKNKFTYPNWSQGLHLGHDIAKVTKVQIIGVVNDLADIDNYVLKLHSTNDSVEYKDSFKVTQLDGNFVQIESEFESIHKAKLYITETSPSVFTSIMSGFIEYTLTAN